MWKFILCPCTGTVNEIDVPLSSTAAEMMNAFENVGFKWASYVDGTTEMLYTLERVKG